MSRLSRARALFISIVALGSLCVVASAGAAAWQGPVSISEPAAAPGASPLISLGSAGDAGASWWEYTTGRIKLARKPAGGTWSAPVTIAEGVTEAPLYLGVDGSGNITAAYTSTGPVTQIVTWAAGAPAPTKAPLGATAMSVQSLAVNSAGDAVISGAEQVSNDIRVAYRHGFTGAWSPWHAAFTGPTFTSPTASDVAINAAGTAVVVFKTFTELWAATRTVATDWPTAAERVTPTNVTDLTPSVGIDAAGGVYAAFTVETGPSTDFLHTSYRAPAGGWEESGNLATATASVGPQIAVNSAGTALLVWQQTSATSILARLGSTGSRIWGPAETVNDAGADVPVVALGDDGRAAVAWERQVSASNWVGQARIREPGSAGVWSDIHNLTPGHANFTQPSVSTDGRGDFATVSGVYFDTSNTRQLQLSFYDAAPPTISAPAISGTLLAGDPVTLAVTPGDSWSTVGTPAWTFGDGGTGSGTSVTHAYATAGTFAVHVTVTDGSGNSASKDVSVTVASPQATLTSAKFAGKWKVSRVTGSLTVVGTVPRAGTYAFDVLKGTSRKIHVSTKITAAGAFTRKITLPAKFLPGTYHVALLPGDAQVKGAARDASLAAPASGVVDVAFLSGARSGTAARTLTGATTIWASFHFAAKPKGTLTLTWYRVGKKAVRIGSTRKNVATKIVSYLRIGKTFVGTYQAVLSRKGVVIARASVNAKKQ